MQSIKCPVEAFLHLIFQKWSAYIIHTLYIKGEIRFGELKRNIPNISQKVLTAKLRDLENASIINRQYKPSIPPQVSYSLSEHGKDIVPIIQQISDIAHKWRDDKKL
ncbi:MAG: winged helix-turn-helix transcriptional regulator [Alphaproteobacteria bacterium]|jgi:DNA-binding HxlR family transcriptional regulator|nr:helix-turn-helix transcriptional regulator [Candidatus Jidaibacter sp.]